MYTNRFSLPFLAGVLIAAAERRRPGLGPWSPQVKDELERAFRSELEEVRARFFEVHDDKPAWEKVEHTLLEVCFPRYCAVAEKQTRLEQSDYDLWRGGDLVARLTYAAAGLLVGVFLVKAPFIPIPETWDLLILVMMLGAPFIPDAQISLQQRRFRRQLAGIVDDMADAEAQQKLYQPLLAADPPQESLQPVEAPLQESGAGAPPHHTREGER